MDLLQLVVAGLSTGSIYALIALGFNIIFKATDAINFAQGEWVMLGGMVTAALYATASFPLLAAGLLALLLVTAVGLISERLIIRRLVDPTPLSITLVSIGLAICTKSLVMLWLGKNPAGYPAFSGDVPLLVAGVALPPQSVWIFVLTGVVMVLAHLFFARTVLGRALRASAADREAAALVGISPAGCMMLSFALAALIGAIAGVIITPLTLTSYDHGTMMGFKGFSAAMLGGLGSLPGAVVGGLVLGLLESLAAGTISSAFKDAVAFIVLLAILFLKPAGLMGRHAVERV
jgi:branched-chain amino acid transport system permease protein